MGGKFYQNKEINLSCKLPVMFGKAGKSEFKQTSKQHGMDKHTGQTHAQWSRIENAEQIHILLVN